MVVAVPDDGVLDRDGVDRRRADEFSGVIANPSYQRESSLTITSSTALSFATRYEALVSADSGLFGDGRLEVLNSDYRLTFTVSAPGAYRVTVATRRKGDLHPT